MRLFRLHEDEIIESDQYSALVYVNLDSVAHLKEIRYKPRPNSKPPDDSWHIYFGDLSVSLRVTKSGFERLREAMESY